MKTRRTSAGPRVGRRLSTLGVGVGLTFAFAAGCSASDADPFFRAGSRIKGRYLVAAGGARLLESLHDIGIDSDCSFGPAADGVVRCLPPNAVTSRYSDADCTQPVLESRRCERNPTYFSAAKDCKSKVYRRADPAIEREVFSWIDGSCRRTQPDGTTTFAGIEIDPAELVGIAETRTEILGEVAVVRTTTEDGASFVGGLSVAATGASCQVTTMDEDGALACIPSYAYGPSAGYADKNCAMPVAVALRSECDVGGTVLSSSSSGGRVASVRTDSGVVGGNGCPVSHYEHYALGEALSDTYEKVGGACKSESTAVSKSTLAFALGPKVDPSTFPRVERSTVGTGRVKETRFLVGDRPVARGSLYVEGHPCHPLPFADGTIRCVHSEGTRMGSSYYSDGVCASEVFASSSCGVSAPYVYTVSPDACFSLEKVFRLGPEIKLAQVYRGDPYGCRLGIVPDGVKLHEIGAEISPASVFPRLTEVVE